MFTTLKKATYVAMLATASFVFFPVMGSAQVQCPTGVTTNDDCANDSTFGDAQETAVIYSQPNISQTAYPVKPSKDRKYRYPNSLIPNQQKSPTITLVVPTAEGLPSEVLANGKIQPKH